MRPLTPSEIGKLAPAISTDDDGGITVVGTLPPPPPTPPGETPGTVTSPADPTNGNPAYVAAHAYSWASSKIQKIYTGPGADDEYARLHFLLSKLYQMAAEHPFEAVNVGGGHYVSAISIFNDIQNTQFKIVGYDFTALQTGAWTESDVIGQPPTVYVDPESPGTQTYNAWPDAKGSNTQLLHEIGHAINYYENPTLFAHTPEGEGAANTAAYNIALLAGGVDMLDNPNGGFY